MAAVLLDPKSPSFACKLGLEIRHHEAAKGLSLAGVLQFSTLVELDRAILGHRVIQATNQNIRSRVNCGSVEK